MEIVGLLKSVPSFPAYSQVVMRRLCTATIAQCLIPKSFERLVAYSWLSNASL